MKVETLIDKLLRTTEQLQDAEFVLKRTEEYKQVEKIKKKVSDIKTDLLEHSVETLKEAQGKLGTLTVTERDNYKIIDWETFRTYVAHNDAYDLFQRSITPTAVKERLADGVNVPGLLHTTTITIKPKFN